MRVSAALAVVSLSCASVACGGKVDVVRTVSPADARVSGLAPTAIVRDGRRIPLPQGTVVERDRVIVPHIERLGEGDVMVANADKQIVAVRSKDGTEVRFVPGTASYDEAGEGVRGELASGKNVTTLFKYDQIEVAGAFEEDDTLPVGGRIERSRSTGLLIGGSTLFVLAYAPSAYIGGISNRSADRSLLVPVVGPFLNLSGRSECVPPPALAQLSPVDPCVEEKATRAALIVSGSVQSLGALLFLLGLPMHTKILPPEERAAKKASPRASVRFVPTTNGAAALGTF